MEEPRPYNKEQLNQAVNSISRTPFERGRDLGMYLQDLSLPPMEAFEGKRILDLGAGPGLRFARELESNGIHSDVVSFSPAFANDEWRKDVFEFGSADKAARLSVAGMAEELPFAGNTFDFVVCHSVVDYLDTRERYLLFLREIVRVLAPNGQAYIGPLVKEPVNNYAEKIPAKQLKKLLGNKAEAQWLQSAGSYNTLVLALIKQYKIAE